jgi:hypothetical protein
MSPKYGTFPGRNWICFGFFSFYLALNCYSQGNCICSLGL